MCGNGRRRAAGISASSTTNISVRRANMTPAEAAGQARYQAGYWNDPGRAFYTYNYKGEPPGGYHGPVEVVRLPIDWQKTVKEIGKFDLNPDSIDDEGSKWWMFENETVPYSKELDATIPVGTVMPGVSSCGNYEGDRAELRGAAKWKDGYWTLEMSRDLDRQQVRPRLRAGQGALHVAQCLRSHADAPHASSASDAVRGAREPVRIYGGVLLCVVQLTINGNQSTRPRAKP